MLTPRVFARAAARAPARARAMGAAAHKTPHVHMPETAMLTNNGTHVWEHKGWEYSMYMAFTIAPAMLYVGITNAPETDANVLARREAYAKRNGHVHTQPEVTVRRPSSPTASRFTYERNEIGERPTLA